MANRNNMGQSVDTGLVSRVVQGIRYVVSGVQPNTWFGPSQPMEPAAQQAEGRQFDYPVGYNLRITPRQGESVSFDDMRALADGYDILRLVIETRKDQMEKMEWTVRPVDQHKPQDSRAQMIQKFLRFPDNEHPWHTWLRMILEEMFVVDALTIYPRMTRGGKLHSLEVVDGTTIKRVLDEDGRTPAPPSAAYQQVLHGMPAVDYSRDQLIYRPRNVRANRIYGYSPVEQIIVSVNIAIRRQLYQLQYYTEGSAPDLIFSMPPTWTIEQVTKFNDWYQDKLSGNLGERRKVQALPGDVKPYDVRAAVLKDEYDEWLARVCCYAFSVSPIPFVKMMNRGTAETQKDAALQEGLYPVMNWVKSVVDYIIWKYFGYTDLEFVFTEEQEIAPLDQAHVNDIYIKNGTLSVDEVRADLGREAIGAPNAVYIATGPMPLGDEAKEAAAQEAPKTAPPGDTQQGTPEQHNAPPQQGADAAAGAHELNATHAHGDSPVVETDGTGVEKWRKIDGRWQLRKAAEVEE